MLEQAADKTLSLRTPEWKYIEPSQGPKIVPWGTEIETGYLSEPQLYGASDSGELENVAARYPDTVKRMQEIVRAVRGNDERLLRQLGARP